MTDPAPVLTAMEDSHARLLDIVDQLGPEDLRTMSYCSAWTIADVLSHLGSGAEIQRLGFEAIVRGDAQPSREVMQEVWDRWNAKSPDEKGSDSVVSDARFVEAVVGLDDEARARFTFSMGPMELDFAGFVRSRLSEHTLHSWDIAVIADPTATVPADAAAFVLPNLGMIAGFVGKPVEPFRSIQVHTTGPDTDVTVAIGESKVSLTPGAAGAPADLTLPAEAFVRLVYGRLDPDHTPAGVDGPEVAQLRQVFPGI